LGEKWPVNLACDSDFHVNHRVFFTCRKSATLDRRLYFPSERRDAVVFFARKIRRLRPGSNPRCWVPEASMLDSRPPKPFTCNVTAYRNAITLQVTGTILSYDLNFHLVPHGVTVSFERYTVGFPVCYGSQKHRECKEGERSGRW
jgi:hypothetical protein